MKGGCYQAVLTHAGRFPSVSSAAVDASGSEEIEGALNGDDGVVGLYWGHQLIPAGAGQGAASHPAGEDVLLADPELLEQVELRFRAPRGIVGLADPGVAVGGRGS